jgi:2-amino-4-hydroxy-6-hydroxymethyldihydropteridine diphosphokinase
LKTDKVILLAGGNHPKTLELLNNAVDMLGNEVGELICTSSLYKTAAWGPIPQPDFVNIAIVLKSNFPAQLLLNKILSIEARLGRRRIIKYGPRTIDIDVLFYGNHIINSKTLTVPHPEIANRRFVLVPCCELIPNFIHPKLKISLSELLLNCPDKLEVSLW